MSANKKLYQTAFLFLLLQQVARSETSSTSQVTPTSCQGYLVPATPTETTITYSPQEIIPEPIPPVISHLPANQVLNPGQEGALTTCTSAIQNCLTQEQAWPQPVNMYHNHRAVWGTLACIPFCWPPLIGILLYGQFCNPPFAEESVELPACCQPRPAFQFPQTQLGTLAAILSRHLNRPLWYSDILLIWLNQLLGTTATASLDRYNAFSAQPDGILVTAVTQGITSLLSLPVVSVSQQNIVLTEVSRHLVSFQNIPVTQVIHRYTDIVSIFILPMASYQVIAIHQSITCTAWMIIPQLQSSGGEPSEARMDFIRRQLGRSAESARIPDQPVIIIRLFIQRP